MVSIPIRFFRGIVHSHQDFKHPNFRFLIVDTIKEVQDETGEWYFDVFHDKIDFLMHDHALGGVFYGVYGSYWIDIPKGPIRLCETTDLKEAINVAQEIMGNTIIDNSNA